MKRNEFADAVLLERSRAVGLGFDAQHDDLHGVDHILAWGVHYAERAWNATDDPEVRARIVKVAGLIESARAARWREK